MINFADQKNASKLIDKYLKECEREKERYDETIGVSETYRYHLANLITAAERLALTALNLQATEKLDKEDPAKSDLIKAMELPDICELKKTEFGFEIYLPILNGKSLELKRRSSDGKLIKSLVRTLMMKHSDLIEKVEDPVIIFEYHIDTQDNLLAYMDADNWSVKLVTDEFQGFFIGDDNALSLTTMHIGVPDKSSFSKVNIIPKKRFLEWGIKNVNIF